MRALVIQIWPRPTQDLPKCHSQPAAVPKAATASQQHARGAAHL